MSTGAVVGIIVVVIVIAALVVAAVVATGALRRARLHRQFGPEYDRLVEERGSRRKAEAELAERERRVRSLSIRELTPEQQARYSGDWTAVQEQFVDTPAEAVTAAHALIWNVMRDRGYPADDRTASLDALSVHHSRSMAGYRATLDLQVESATTEQLREAMIRYRSLFEDLAGLHAGRGDRGRHRVTQIRDRAAGPAEPAADDPAASVEPAAEPAAAEPAAAEPAAAEPAAAVEHDEVRAENAGRTADTPR